jgi:adenylate kinase family enzyme
MNKVCVVGCPGSGKSIMARRLGEVTGLPVYHLDVYFLKPGWVEREKEEWLSIVHDLLKNDKWIMDGNYDGTQDIRFPKADTIIFLDLPRYKCMLYALKRLFIYRNKTRIDVPEGCHESFDFDFYKWIWNFNKNHGKRTVERIEKLQGQKEIIILKNHKEMDRYLEKIKNEVVTPER